MTLKLTYFQAMICPPSSAVMPNTSMRRLYPTELWPLISAKWSEGKCYWFFFSSLVLVNRCLMFIMPSCHSYRKEDGTLRTMPSEKLLKTLPILQSQLDALLEFDCTANELTNGVINTAFMLLFRDLIRLFACYNDGIINLLGNVISWDNSKHLFSRCSLSWCNAITFSGKIDAIKLMQCNYFLKFFMEKIFGKSLFCCSVLFENSNWKWHSQ